MKTKIIIILCSVLIVVAAAAAVAIWHFWPRGQQKVMPVAASPEEVQKQYFEKGEKLYKEKYYAPFVAVYEKMLKELPDNMDLKKKLAFAYFGVGRYKDAKELLKIVVESPVADAEAFYELGFIERMDGDSESAKKHLKKAIELDPNHKDAKNALNPPLD